MAGDHRRRCLAEEESLKSLASVGFGLAAASAWGLADYFIAIYSRRLGWFKALVTMSTFAAVAFSLFYVVVRPEIDLSSRGWLAVVVWAALVLPNYVLFYKALELGPLAIVTPVVAAYAAVVVLLAMIFLGERLNSGQFAGTILAIAGIIGASADLRALEPGVRRVGPGVVLALFCLGGFGVASFLGGLLAKEYGWFVPAFLLRWMITVVLIGAAGATRNFPWKAGTPKTLIGAGIFGILEASGFLLFSRGAEVGLLSIVAAASASYPLIPLVLGLVVLKEKLAPNQKVGVVAVILGVVLLGLSG